MLTITPQARAIAALTLSVLLLLGALNKIWLAFALLLGASYPSGRGGQFLTAVVLVAVLLGFGSVVGSGSVPGGAITGTFGY